ncbi:MAG: MerR family transcriptional regulator [Chloroflexota bacterium]
MLKIGNFSRIANVSVRLLHHYEEIGLFEPAYIDPVSRYRYYKSEQAIQLHKILVLKELGFTLQEIKRYVDQEISHDELMGMLYLKKSQVYQKIEQDLLRLKRIENRLSQLENNQSFITTDVIIKPVDAQTYLSVRNPSLPIHKFNQVLEKIMSAIGKYQIDFGTLAILEHSQTFPDNTFDLEIGFIIATDKQLSSESLTVTNSLSLSEGELPYVSQMATLLHIGEWGTAIRSYIALGTWIETHGFEIVGATREIYHDIAVEEGGKNVVEIQLPIQATERIFS